MKTLLNKFTLLSFLVLISLVSAAQIKNTTEIIIKGRFTGAEVPDTLVMFVYDRPIFRFLGDSTGSPKKIVQKVVNKSFNFKIPDISHPVYIGLADKSKTHPSSNPLIDISLAEPGDNVTIDFGKYLIPPIVKPNSGMGLGDTTKQYIDGVRETTYSGIGFAKYKYQMELIKKGAELEDAIIKRGNLQKYAPITLRDFKDFDVYGLAPVKVYCDELESLLIAKNELLEKYRKVMPAATFEILKLRNIGSIRDRQSKTLAQNALFSINRDKLSADDLETILVETKKLRSFIASKFDLKPAITGRTEYSWEYLNYLKRIIFYKGIFNEETRMQGYKRLHTEYDGTLRDILLTISIANDLHADFNNNKNKIIDDALAVVKDPTCRKIVLRMANNKIGSLAFPFELPDAKGNIIKMSDLKGKIVMLDMYYWGCIHCAHYYEDVLHKLETEFADRKDIVFVTISVDQSKDIFLKGLNSGVYTSTDASNVINLYTGGVGMDSPIIRHYGIQGYPTPMLFDKNGILVASGTGPIRKLDGLRKLIEGLL